MFSVLSVSLLHHLSGIRWVLEQNVNESELIEYRDSEAESPECGVRPEEGAVRHYGHAQHHPEEEGSEETPPTIVCRVLH